MRLVFIEREKKQTNITVCGEGEREACGSGILFPISPHSGHDDRKLRSI